MKIKHFQQLHVKFQTGAFKGQHFRKKINLYKICIFSAERVNPDCHNSILQSAGQQQCLLYDVVLFMEIFKRLNYFLGSIRNRGNINKEGETTIGSP